MKEMILSHILWHSRQVLPYGGSSNNSVKSTVLTVLQQSPDWYDRVHYFYHLHFVQTMKTN